MSTENVTRTPREQWRLQTSFVMATIGAAVGLGNIWRFSYVAGENGGATFLVVYLAAILLIALPLALAEAAIGRHSQYDAVASYRAISRERIWIGAGVLGVIGSYLIMCFYLVIAGWALKYLFGAVSGILWRLAARQYGHYVDAFVASPWEPVAWQFSMAILAVAVVARGVRGGIERMARAVTPVLAVIVAGLAIYGVAHQGAGRGLSFLFAPDWTRLLGADLYLAALGQAFFSLSLGMGLYVTYGSYLGREHRLPRAVAAVAAGDTLIRRRRSTIRLIPGSPCAARISSLIGPSSTRRMCAVDLNRKGNAGTTVAGTVLLNGDTLTRAMSTMPFLTSATVKLSDS